MKPPSFNVWAREQEHVGPSGKWVVARRTANMVRRHGEETTFFSPKRYRELCEEHRIVCREMLLEEIASKHRVLNYVALREAYEAGRGATYG